MILWKQYKLTEKQGYKLGFLPCPCGIIHDHKLTVEKFLWWVRFPSFGGKKQIKML